MLTDQMIAELKALEKPGVGLRTEDVVSKAKEATSALHQHPAFEWNIKKAAEAQWHDAARTVIQVYFVVIKDGKRSKTMRHYVHMSTAAGKPIYRSTARVLAENRSALVNIVCDRIVSAIHSYPLQEFDPVLALVEKIRGDSGEGGGSQEEKAA